MDDALTLTIDGNRIDSIAAFYDEINRVFMQGEDWRIGANLDALGDLLYGGYGALLGHEHTVLIWHNMALSREVLGFEATRRFYLAKLVPDSPFDKPAARQKLAALERGEGPTYFEIVLEIIAEHPAIELRPA